MDQSLPVSRKLGPKFKFLPLISAPPKGFWEKFCHHTIGGFSSCLSSKIGGPSPIPQFWGNFYPTFGVPTWPTPGKCHIWQNYGATSQQAKHSPAPLKLPLMRNSWRSALPPSIPITQSVRKKAQTAAAMEMLSYAEMIWQVVSTFSRHPTTIPPPW